MSSLTSRIAAALAVFLTLGCIQQASASDSESLRLKRDLRACIDKSLAQENSRNSGDVAAVLSTCETELRSFTDSIDDAIRLEAMRSAITGYVQANLEPVRAAKDTTL